MGKALCKKLLGIRVHSVSLSLHGSANIYLPNICFFISVSIAFLIYHPKAIFIIILTYVFKSIFIHVNTYYF